MKPRDDDLLTILDYLDGNLSEAEAIALELRFVEDPDLSSERDALERMDHLQRAALAGRPVNPSVRRARASIGRGVLALAALVLVWSGVSWLLRTSDSSGPEPRVSILASAPTLREHNRRLGLPEADLLMFPPGFGLRTGSEEGELVSAEEYLSLTSAFEERRLAEALEAPSGTASTATFFVLPVRTPQDTFAVVLIVGPDGASLAYPAAPWRARAGRLAGGLDHVLPQPNLVQLTDATGVRIEYAPGFLVPRHADELQVLVGLRAEPLSEDLRLELQAAADDAASPAALASRLASSGFDVTRLRVQAR